MRYDLMTVGINGGVRNWRVAASATRYYAGEPIHCVGTFSSGAITVNTCVVAAADTPVIGTHQFKGIATRDAQVTAAGVVIAHEAEVALPIPNVTIIRGVAETTTGADTDAELLAILGDVTLIDYAATGSVLSGPLYTILQTASADTSGLTIVNGNTAKATLDVVVDPRAIRNDVS